MTTERVQDAAGFYTCLVLIPVGLWYHQVASAVLEDSSAQLAEAKQSAPVEVGEQSRKLKVTAGSLQRSIRGTRNKGRGERLMVAGARSAW